MPWFYHLRGDGRVGVAVGVRGDATRPKICTLGVHLRDFCPVPLSCWYVSSSIQLRHQRRINNSKFGHLDWVINEVLIVELGLELVFSPTEGPNLPMV